MNCRRETAKMGVPPGNRPAVPRDWFRGVPERYVAGVDTRGRQEGRPYPWSQQVIHEISGLDHIIHATLHETVKMGVPNVSRGDISLKHRDTILARWLNALRNF